MLLGAPRRGNLVVWLHEQGHVTKVVLVYADHVRWVGTLGAHFPDEGQKDEHVVLEDDARAAFDFMHMILETIFVAKARLDRLRITKGATQ